MALCAYPLGEIETARLVKAEPHYACPVPNEGTATLRSDAYGKGYYGARRSNGRRHKGLDLCVDLGQPVMASKSGRVRVAGTDTGYGLFVEILHADGLCTRYAHLSALSVRQGQWVSRGQTIGKAGKSGNASHPAIIPHVHFEIRYKKHALNPNDRLFDPSLKIK